MRLIGPYKIIHSAQIVVDCVGDKNRLFVERYRCSQKFFKFIWKIIERRVGSFISYTLLIINEVSRPMFAKNLILKLSLLRKFN